MIREANLHGRPKVTDLILPHPSDVQIDKRGDEWLLTYWVDADTTVQLRIRHAGALEPSEFLCELADVASDYEFRLVGRFLWHRDDDPELFEWPSCGRNEFLSLSRVWAKCLELGEWGLALGDAIIVRDEFSLVAEDSPATDPTQMAVDSHPRNVRGESYA